MVGSKSEYIHINVFPLLLHKYYCFFFYYFIEIIFSDCCHYPINMYDHPY
jgi:hypothetical protein